ncbi:MAPEG family protein [Shimia ponticola]|uniref:MAPEG family protein n=1 Tax=Shimia ponticola TaxID=2582893 RepID=UPI0011BD9346|nr:MAPEG family protein [Shimia ponticola]
MPIITAWAALFCGALFFALTVRVIMGRRSSKVSLGDGGDPMLERRIRGQGNAAEQMPITLIPLFAAELAGAPVWLVALSAFVFCVGRLMHGIAFGWMTFSPMRLYGFALSLLGTLGALLSLAVALVL